MAALENDSESENEASQRMSPAPGDGEAGREENTHAPSDDDEEDIVVPKGRMASRMQTGNAEHDSNGGTAFERVSRMFREERENENGREGEDGDKPQSSDDGDDDLPTAGRRRKPARENKDSEQASRARSFSPLFMSSPTATRQINPEHGQSEDGSSGDDGDVPQPKGNARFLALVAQKRIEREEKERAEAEKKTDRRKQMEHFSSEILSGEDSGDEGGSARKLTQQSRPARKASKKALEDMHRETQRMSRNMQLTHQMQTKKKITKESLFARFNFMQPEAPATTQAADASSTTADSHPSSDIEGHKRNDTPPTSPVLGPEKDIARGADKQAQSDAMADEELPDPPTLDGLLNEPPQQPKHPVVGRVETQTPGSDPAAVKSTRERKSPNTAPIRVRLSPETVAQQQKEDSDDDLEVVTSPGKCRRYAAFENLPARTAQESPAMINLKALANLTSPTRKRTMNAAELSASLLYRARLQAAQERRERIQELRDKGVVIETAEERAAMEDTVEDLMERARKEGEDIARKERKAAKQQGQADVDDEEDDDYELSGSDAERNADDEDEDDEGECDNAEDGFVENEAGEADESEDGESDAMSEGEAALAPTRRKRPTRVISDDEDDDEPQVPRTPAKQITPSMGSVERPQFPKLPGSNGLTMGLTQAFAGTLGDDDVGTEDGSTNPLTVPDPVRPGEFQEGDSQVMVKDSQDPQAEPVDLLAGYSWPDERVSESPAHHFSQAPDPTQDAGFVLSPFDPSKRFMGTPTSTVETVLVSQDQQHGSPQKKGRLLKRGQAPRLSAIEEGQEDDFEINASAFDVMKKAAKKPAVPFDRNASKAKEVVEDAAEESDDEYAGLGGGSDDSEDEENVYDQQMINDNSGEKVDEKQLAALNA